MRRFRLRLSSIPPTTFRSTITIRQYAKKTTKSKLSALPQGALPPLPALPADSAPTTPKYPTVIQQALDNMSRLGPSCVLLTRVGGFYELYFHQADTYAPQLGIKVAQKHTARGKVSMAGFPVWQLERYMKMLVEELRVYVAVCEEYMVDGGAVRERRIARVVTPGTLVDEEWVEGGENHFLMAVDEHGGAAAWADIGTGEFWCQTMSEEAGIAELVERIVPREIVVGAGGVSSVAEDPRWVLSRLDVQGGEEVWGAVLEGEKVRDGLSEPERRAAERLLAYVRARLPDVELSLQEPVRAEKVMGIDVNSLRGLEIKATVKDGVTRGSLFNIVDRTVTRGGRRLLGLWLTCPSTDIDTIEARLDLVETFLRDEQLRTDMVAALKKSHDSQRIVQKFSLGRGSADDLILLARTIEATEVIRKRLKMVKKSKRLSALVKELQPPLDLAGAIWKAIDEEGLMEKQRVEESEVADIVALAEAVDETIVPKSRKKSMGSRSMMKETEREKSEPWIMQKTASPILTLLHQRLDELMEEKSELEETLRATHKAPSLTLRWTPGLGHICHVKTRDSKSLAHATSVSTSRSTSCFHLAPWTTLGTRIDTTRLSIRAGENEVFVRLRKSVITHLRTLRQNAHTLDSLDVATSFANLAQERSLTRPVLTSSPSLTILGGRHITVETALRSFGTSFTPNDCILAPPVEPKAWLITGPNMAGKSTFLRQTALLCILAQSGSFVPATHAEVGIVDRLFSRVGSADNLFSGKSTFFVEMEETAHILRRATPRSLVIMDEVGRGTTPREGEAVAAASLRYLVDKVGCRALFATHFHGELMRSIEGVGSWCTDLEEAEDGSWTFVHRLRRGVNKRSHALKIAQLAGIPGEVVRDAEGLLGKGQV